LIQGVRAESQPYWQERKRCLVVAVEGAEVALGNQKSSLVAEVAAEAVVERAV
jgi:hypothetical protein